MKKIMRVLLCSTVVIALLAGLQLTAFANESSIDETASIADIQNTTPVAGVQNAETAATGGTTHPDIMPISNPDTGAEGMVIPAIAALLASATAAVALTGKKK